MSVKSSGWLYLIASAFLAAGLIIGFSPVRSGPATCGNAFHGERVRVLWQDDCDAARSSRQVETWVPLAAFAIALFGGVLASHAEISRA